MLRGKNSKLINDIFHKARIYQMWPLCTFCTFWVEYVHSADWTVTSLYDIDFANGPVLPFLCLTFYVKELYFLTFKIFI